MTSEAQSNANRANAQRSTGPKSPAGKARSGRNALTHGLTAGAVVIRGEDPKEFEALQARFVSEFAPEFAIEAELVAQAAAAAWRLRRGPRFEAAVFAAREADVAAQNDGDGAEVGVLELGDILVRDATDGDALGKVARYEGALSRRLERTIATLLELRESRPPEEPSGDDDEAKQPIAT